MVERWEKNNANRVAGLSSGRLAYVHIPSMDEERGWNASVRGLYSDAADKDGLIIDLRNNGGGFTHDTGAGSTLACPRPTTSSDKREGGEGPVMRANDRKWNRSPWWCSSTTARLQRRRDSAQCHPRPDPGASSSVSRPAAWWISTYQTQLIDGSNFRIPTWRCLHLHRASILEKEGVRSRITLSRSIPTKQPVASTRNSTRPSRCSNAQVQNWKKTNPNGTSRPSDGLPLPPMPSGPESAHAGADAAGRRTGNTFLIHTPNGTVRFGERRAGGVSPLMLNQGAYRPQRITQLSGTTFAMDCLPTLAICWLALRAEAAEPWGLARHGSRSLNHQLQGLPAFPQRLPAWKPRPLCGSR